MRLSFLLLNTFFFLFFFGKSQLIKTVLLNNDLKEISGIEAINDTLLAAHNDGGNKPIIYLINTNGLIIKKIVVRNAKNTDWEDLTKDNQGNLYIGDIGNNSNKRKNLQIVKIRISDLFEKDTVDATFIPFSYQEQQNFPTQKNEMYFDAESLTYFNDSLWIFTKCKTFPYDGISYIYAAKLSDAQNNSFKKVGEFISGKRGWKWDSFTAATTKDNVFFLLTYNRLIQLKREGNQFVSVGTIRFKKYKQREALTFTKKFYIIANENHRLLGRQRLNFYKYE